MKYDEKVHHTLWALSFFFSSLSFYHGLDMFLATRDALVINGSYPGFFTSSYEKITPFFRSYPYPSSHVMVQWKMNLLLKETFFWGNHFQHTHDYGKEEYVHVCPVPGIKTNLPQKSHRISLSQILPCIKSLTLLPYRSKRGSIERNLLPWDPWDWYIFTY